MHACIPEQSVTLCLPRRNEALNSIRMQELLDSSEFCSADIVIPVAYMGLTTRCTRVSLPFLYALLQILHNPSFLWLTWASPSCVHDMSVCVSTFQPVPS